MFKINTEKELLALLKVVSEEAVKKSKRNLKESSDPYAERFSSNLDNEIKALYEQEEEEEVEDEAPAAEEAEEEEVPAEEEVAEEEEPVENEELPAAEKALSLDDGEISHSFDSVVTAINTLRAGRSLRDKEIKTELNGYYDRLDENEREILFLFLKELSKILTGAIDGDEAQDPSDPKHYFDISKRNEEEPESAPKSAEGEVSAEPEVVKAMSTGDEEEDTSPPIKVNESQDLSALREKVRRLMRD
mgnify:CR=1 FL=1